MASAGPLASIIVPAYRSEQTIGRALAALVAQRCPDFEVVVVDSSPDDRTAAIMCTSFPEVCYLHEAGRLLPHEARNRGAELASGQVLVFTDADCVAEPDWLERLLAHHASGRAVVGGSVGSLPDLWNQSAHLTKYPWWDPQSPGGWRREIASGNFSVARDVFDAVQGFCGPSFAADSEICRRIRARGHEIWFEPGAVVVHLDHGGPGQFARERFSRGRHFGRTRIRTERWSRGRCLRSLFAAPIVPFLTTVRSARFAMRGGYLRRWIPTAPVQFVGSALWSLGEAVARAKAVRSG